MTDMTVAKTILEQLGGRVFVAMTGASNFFGQQNSLIFTLPEDVTDVWKVKVTLAPSDTYVVEFWGRSGACLETLEDIYCDSLRDVFERVTGLYTSLSPRTKVHHFVDKKA
jgi:hypothetical protein